MQYFKDNAGLANLFVRLGLAATLLFSVFTKFTQTGRVSEMFGALIGVGSEGFVLFMAVVLAIIAVLLVIGWQVRLMGLLLTVFFLVAIISSAVNGEVWTGLAVWKDLGLLGASLGLLFGGAGDASLDT